jgi:hypothetical protein
MPRKDGTGPDEGVEINAAVVANSKMEVINRT